MTSPVLSDRFQRRVNYLRVSITDRCNLRCRYCMPAAGVQPLVHGEILSYEELLRVARVAVGLGVEKIRVTGGEPLVRKGVVSFVGRVAKLEGLRDFSLTTNGLLLGEMAEQLAGAGLRRVNVSLDTLQPHRFRTITRRDGLERVLAGLTAARRAGLAPVKVNVVVMRGVNDDEVVDFAGFAAREDLEVRFIEYMPSTAGAWDDAQLLPAGEILSILQARYRLEPEERQETGGPSRTFRLPTGGRVGVISPLSNHFCSSCNRLRLTAVGRLRSCLFSEEETDLRELLRGSSSDEDVARALRDAVSRKGEGHRLSALAPTSCGLTMSRVGG